MDEDRDAARTARLQLAEALRRATGDFVRRVRAPAATSTDAQGEALALLARAGPMNVAALAERRGVTHQTMQRVVEALVAAGLVERRPDPADRRSRLLALSDIGAARVARDRAGRAARIAALIEASLAPEEEARLAEAIALLERLSAAPEG
ncbi:MarR family winged helix-turn-helix transcriptional regulator [Sphingomonas morindae]|uniref:MarR family winged helix-turn-helix transcriptional regulator n=1 Tax=Sphingomonas morindae TaxID=1541170 RepID=UPI0026774932|nr:MarR family transcriptional regulator [Sphingomonas morindae]